MHRLASLISKFSQQFQLLGKRNSGGPQPPTIFLFGVNFILPTIQPWSQTLQRCSQYDWICQMSLTAKTMVISCHYMIKIMHSQHVLYIYNKLCSPPPPPPPFEDSWIRHWVLYTSVFGEEGKMPESSLWHALISPVDDPPASSKWFPVGPLS